MQKITAPGWMIAALAVVCLAIVLWGIHAALRKSVDGTKRANTKILLYTASALAAWMTVVGMLAAKGFFSDFSTLPPRPVLTILLPLPVILYLALSGKADRLLRSAPVYWLIGMQSFRIVVEFILYTAFNKGTLPEQMTFSGLNFDIVSGIIAIPLAFWYGRKKQSTYTAGIWFNILGILLLLNVLVIALLSMPVPFRYFHHEPSVAVVGSFPFIYLPAILVVLAYSLHILSLRQLYILKKV